jgi:signal transduction histidine kinase
MEAPSPELERRWRRWLVERNRRGLRAALLIVFLLYPSFGLLDWIMVAPSALLGLWAVRAAVVAVTFALYFLTRSAAWERASLAATMGFAWVTSAGIAAMTTAAGGLASPYYAGISLAVTGAGLLFVWPLWAVVATYGSIVATWVALNLAAGAVGDTASALSNLAFLSALALIVGVGQVITFRAQREQLAQRIRLEEATANLEQAHQELKQLDEFKSRFFANMTHELRTPLALVLTPLELLMQGEMGEFTEVQKSSFLTMYRSALKLLKLINDLLDLSRLEESRLRLDVAEHDLGAYLAGLTEETQVLARRKGIALAYEAPVGRVPVTCDLERLERVFVNLLSNAIKFTPPGGHVALRLADRGEEVEVVVEDDGPGFPPEASEKLFERFYQVDSAGTRQHGGAGIGLALAREIVQLHGGTIDAWSDGGHGARLRVLLRKGRGHLRPEALVTARAAAAEAEGEAHQDWAVQLAARRDFRLLDIEEAAERRVVERDVDEVRRPFSVVVVEDNAQILQLIHMTLRRDFRVLVAQDGWKGLELVRRERPNLVVTDLMMPGLDGLGLVKHLRDDKGTHHVPIIMLTARGDLEDRLRGLEQGANVYLTKPFAPRELLTCARQLVQGKEETADLVLTQRMESLEIVAAGLAHEMNNPLNYVKNALARVAVDSERALGLAAQAGERPLGEADREVVTRLSARVKELLRVADSGLRRITGTVELMGRYGRAGYQRQLVPHDAWEAVRTVVGVVLPATGRAVRVETSLTGDGVVECVPEEFNQVVSNLVQNAIEAVADGIGVVRVTGTSDEAFLRLTVRDNGPGIEPEAMGRLFTPFFTTKGPGRGTGLGLTISRRVVESLKGTLKVQSTPGQGATFLVELPLRQGRTSGPLLTPVPFPRPL